MDGNFRSLTGAAGASPRPTWMRSGVQMGVWRFRLRASSFCSGAKGTKRPPGAAHGHLTMPYPAAPRTPCFLRGAPPRGCVSLSGAGKNQDACLSANRCRSVLLEQLLAPTRPIAPSFHPSRGGSVVASPPWLVPDTQNFCEHTCSGFAPASGFVDHRPIPALDLPGYRPPGGTSNRGDATGTQWKPSAAGSIGRGRAMK